MANSTAAKAVAKPKGDGLWSRIAKFTRECYVETWHKSSWPTWSELRQYTLVVLFALCVVALWIAALDLVLKTLTAAIPGR